MMKCEQVEYLLPALVEGGINGPEEERVREHVSECAHCRDALASYEELETALLARSEEVPPAADFARAVFVQARPSRLRGFLHAALSYPAMASVGFVLFGVFLFVRRDVTSAIVTGATRLLEKLSLASSQVGGAYSQVDGLDVMWVGGVYLALTLTILTAISMMVYRFVKS